MPQIPLHSLSFLPRPNSFPKKPSRCLGSASGFRAEDGGNRVVPPGKGLFPFPEFFRAAAGRGLRCPCVVEDCRPGDLSGALAFLEESGAGLVAGP